MSGDGLEHEMEKLKSFILGQFEEQRGLLRDLTCQVQRSTRHTPGWTASIPEHELIDGTYSQASVSSEKGVQLPRISFVDASQSPETQNEDANEIGADLGDHEATVQVMEASRARGSLAKAGSLMSLDSTDTFVSGFLERSEQKAYTAANRLTQIRNTALMSQNLEPQFTCKAFAKRLVSSHMFVYAVTSVIVFNLVVLGIEVEASTHLGISDIPTWFGLCNGIVVGLFTLELSVNLYAQGFSSFFCGRERWRNLFDLLIIVLSLLETVLDLWAAAEAANSGNQALSPSQLRFARSIRLARALRGIRVMRLLRYVSALRTLVLSIMSSMASLMWTLVLLLLLFYSFGVLFTQMVTDECRFQAIMRTEDPNSVPSCLNTDEQGNLIYWNYWDSISTSMLTLFMATTGGIDWDVALKPLGEISVFAGGCLVVYVIITFFAIVNVITGVFVTTAMETTSADKDLAVMKQLQKHQAQVEDLKALFSEISGGERNEEVSIDQFKAAMSIPKFAAFLQSMGISTDLEDVGVLFKLLDADASGLVELDEFIKGCLNLHGTAKGLQLARMSYENKLTRREIKHLHHSVARLHDVLRTGSEHFQV